MKLLVDCDGASNCFETTTTLTDWIWGVRDPSEAAPLLVEIGPGEFPGGLTCGIGDWQFLFYAAAPAKRFHYVTFRGAGPDVTRIGARPEPNVGIDVWAIGADGCTNLNFEALTADGGLYGIFWQGTGSSRWYDVNSFAQVPWYDFHCPNNPAIPRPVHYVFSSRFEGRSSEDADAAYVSECGENWVYGTDIVAVGTGRPEGSTPAAVRVADEGDFRAFGSTIRVTSGPNLAGGTGVEVGYPSNLQGSEGGGRVHLHGTIVNVDVSGSPGADAIGLDLHPTPASPMMVHSVETAFNLNAGSGGDVKRVSGEGAEAPYQWPAGTGVPKPNFSSDDGQDTYIETDCASSGNCEAAGTETHLMIYNAARCPAARWFNSTTGCCRNELLPACKQ